METAKLTSKGQLVIPKRIRDAVHAGPGTEFEVRLEDGTIVLQPKRRRGTRLSDWRGLNPRGVKLSDRALCEPVVLSPDDDRG